MADLDHKHVWGSGALNGFVKQSDGNPVTVLQIPLTQGRQYSFAFLVSSRDNESTGSAATLRYYAVMAVDVLSYDNGSEEHTWDVDVAFLDMTGNTGTLSSTWAASMSTDTLTITADSAANNLHMLMSLGGAQVEFFADQLAA